MMEVRRRAPPACHLRRAKPPPTPPDLALPVSSRRKVSAARLPTQMFWLLVFGLLAQIVPAARADVSTLASARAKMLQLRKCCGAQQQLQLDLHGCEQREGGNRQDTEGFPWWLHPNTLVYDADVPALPGTPAHAQRVEALRTAPPGLPCAKGYFKYFTWDSTKRYRLLSNGSLLLRLDVSSKSNGTGAVAGGSPALASMLLLPPGEFCADVLMGYHVFLACPCHRTTCVRKCCARSQRLEIELDINGLPSKTDCVNYKPMWLPHFVDASSNGSDGVRYILLDAAVPSCEEGHSLVLARSRENPPDGWALTEGSVRVLPDGSAIFWGYEDGKPFAADSWCGDKLRLPEDEGGGVVGNALACMERRAQPRTAVSLIYGSLFVVSAFCLLLTLAVHALLPEMRRSAHNKATLCHVAALLCASLALAYGQLNDGFNSSGSCYIDVFIVQYSMLAAFFWLNVICFDVARGFREVLPPSGDGELRKFLLYSLYAWGCPAIISAVTAALEFTEDLPVHLVRPQIAYFNTCWFYSLAAKFAYFYGIMAALLLANTILYGSTAAQLIRVRKETKVLDKENADAAAATATGGGSAAATGSALRNRKERAMLHLKLFLLMGVTWMMECVSVLAGVNDVYWLLPDSVNILRGVFVFVLLCCKRDVWRRLRQRALQLATSENKSSGGGACNGGTGRDRLRNGSGSGSASGSASAPTRNSDISLHSSGATRPHTPRDLHQDSAM